MLQEKVYRAVSGWLMVMVLFATTIGGFVLLGTALESRPEGGATSSTVSSFISSLTLPFASVLTTSPEKTGRSGARATPAIEAPPLMETTCPAATRLAVAYAEDAAQNTRKRIRRVEGNDIELNANLVTIA